MCLPSSFMVAAERKTVYHTNSVVEIKYIFVLCTFARPPATQLIFCRTRQHLELILCFLQNPCQESAHGSARTRDGRLTALGESELEHSGLESVVVPQFLEPDQAGMRIQHQSWSTVHYHYHYHRRRRQRSKGRNTYRSLDTPLKKHITHGRILIPSRWTSHGTFSTPTRRNLVAE